MAADNKSGEGGNFMPYVSRYRTLIELYTLFAQTLTEEQRTELRRQIFAEAGVSLGEERVAQDPRSGEANTTEFRRSALHCTVRVRYGRHYLLLDPEVVREVLSVAEITGYKALIVVHDDGALSVESEQAWLEQPRSLTPFTVHSKE